MAVKENNLLKNIQLKLSQLGWRLFRNNTGSAWVGYGKPIRIKQSGKYFIEAGSVVLEKARPINYGLAVGGGDLFGFRPVVITQEMVGTTIAQVANVEGKTSSTKTTKEQLNFHNFILNSGGFSKIVRSEEELP
jgi:hypothetical protein